MSHTQQEQRVGTMKVHGLTASSQSIKLTLKERHKNKRQQLYKATLKSAT